MAHKRNTARLEMEARRRQHDAARIADLTTRRLERDAARLANEFHALRLEEVRRTLREAAAREAYARQLAEAMAPLPGEFLWKPWGYEIPDPPARIVRTLRAPLRLVVDNPEPRAHDRFSTVVASPRGRALAVAA